MRIHAGSRDFRRSQPRHTHLKLRPEYILIVAIVCVSCGTQTRGGQLPSDVAETISSINDDIAAERYAKIYEEASELWRQDATVDQSTAVFKTIKAKLGNVKTRELHSAMEQQNSGGPLKGRAYIVTYQTSFEKGEGMETFTLVERDHQWKLARYLVNSTALQ